MNEGKKDRRDPIRTVKPRNFVAKNASATTSGAGAHKDKKKAAKQGDVKHKNAEYAESLQHMLESALRDKEDLQAKRKTLQDLSMNKDVDQKAVTQRKLDLEKEAKKKGISEGRVKELMMDLRALTDAEFQAQYKMTKAQARAGLAGKNESMAEEFDSPEYNDEAGMAEGNLLTLARAVKGLYDTIEDDDNLPEWCQEKIAKAEQMLVTVWDYLLSQKERGIDPSVKEAGVTEGSAHGYNVAKWYEKNGDQLKLTRWLRKEAGLPKDAPVYFDDADLVYGDKTIVPGALVNPKLKFNDLLTALVQVTGGQGKQNIDGVYREGWTHDSLAAQLFETENTYEQQLAGKLARQLKNNK
jgi:hypothetical protein